MQDTLVATAPRAPIGGSAAQRGGESRVTAVLVLTLVAAPALSVSAADWADHLSWLPVFAGAGVLFALLLSARRTPAPMAHTLALVWGVIVVTAYFMSVADSGTWQERLAWLASRVGAWIEVALSGGASSDTLLFSLTMS